MTILRRALTLLRKQSGMTLVELLASLFIFLAILIPLTSVYISGVTVYNQTMEQTSLRNEADFVIGEVMRTVQGASYFELAPDSNESEKETLLAIMRSDKAGHLITSNDDSAYRGSLMLYASSTLYEPEDPEQEESSDNPSITKSVLTRTLYRFTPPEVPNDLEKSFPVRGNYLARGLFAISPDNKALTLYLVIAPFGEKKLDQDGQRMTYRTLEEILTGLDKSASSDKVNRYIRLVKTDFAVSNLRRGE